MPGSNPGGDTEPVAGEPCSTMDVQSVMRPLHVLFHATELYSTWARETFTPMSPANLLRETASRIT